MNKVKCSNGHFYNADRFKLCPICGAESAITLDKKLVRKPVDEFSHTEPLLPDMASKDIAQTSEYIISPINELASTEMIQPEEEPHYAESAAQSKSAERVIPANSAAHETESVPRQRSGQSPLSEAVAETGSKSISALPETVSYYDLDNSEPPVGWVICVKGPYLGSAFVCKVGRNRIGRIPDYEICLLEDAAVNREAHAILIYDPMQKQFFLQAGTGDGLAYINGKLLFAHEELHPYDKIALGNSEFVFLPLCGERFTWDEYITMG